MAQKLGAAGAVQGRNLLRGESFPGGPKLWMGPQVAQCPQLQQGVQQAAVRGVYAFGALTWRFDRF